MYLPKPLPRTITTHLKRFYSKLADSSKWEKIPIGGNKWRSNFYTITHSDGTDNTSLEGFFSRIETHIPNWLRDDGISPGERGEKEYWLAWFIATQSQRTPYAAQVRLEHNPLTPKNMPVGALITANLTEAKWMARKIFSWHWQIRKLDVYQSKEELLLGETCIFSHPPSQGLLCNVQRQTILQCSPLIATQCEMLSEASKEELARIRVLNDATISASAACKSYIYRTKKE